LSQHTLYRQSGELTFEDDDTLDELLEAPNAAKAPIVRKPAPVALAAAAKSPFAKSTAKDLKVLLS